MLFNHEILEGQTWQPGETRTCTFVFIGRDLDREALVAGFQKCKVRGGLNFSIARWTRTALRMAAKKNYSIDVHHNLVTICNNLSRG